MGFNAIEKTSVAEAGKISNVLLRQLLCVVKECDGIHAELVPSSDPMYLLAVARSVSPSPLLIRFFVETRRLRMRFNEDERGNKQAGKAIRKCAEAPTRVQILTRGIGTRKYANTRSG